MDGGGRAKRASSYTRPYEARVGDLYRSERSELRRDRDSPTHPKHYVMVMNKFLLGGWVERPNVFIFVLVSCFRCLLGRLAFFCLLCCAWSALRVRCA